MKQPSRKTLRNKLDKICSEIVRSRGKCERCGNTLTLQSCHIFSRKYNNTRWSLDNLLCLCAKCHFMFHAEPILFGEWVKKHLGTDRYELLKEAHNKISKFTLHDLDIKLKVLNDLRHL